MKAERMRTRHSPVIAHESSMPARLPQRKPGRPGSSPKLPNLERGEEDETRGSVGFIPLGRRG